MKKFLSFCLLLTLGGCAIPSSGNSYQLYYVNEYSSTGQALQSVVRYLPEDQEEIDIKTLVEAHLEYGIPDDVQSPFPSGTTVLRGEVLENGLAEVTFSSEYGELSGIEKTVADFAVFHTIIQLPRVNAVQIHVQGEEEEPPVLKEGAGVFME
ncbi:MAG: GerMN domain-containing protein [Eubacteriales bacterium]